MNYRGKVFDQYGQPLIAAHITTLFEPKRGVITDFDGVFVIGDARVEESWQVSYLGFKTQIFTMKRNVNNGNFVLKEDAYVLEEFVGYPTKPVADVILPTDPFKLPNFGNQFQNLIDKQPQRPIKKGFWQTLKDNPILAVGVGLVTALGVGALMAQAGKISDRAEQKRLALAK